ncbi:MAG: TonB-dependent receptor [Bacteroidetes bacterium]|nr:TonB-dependent receptor [Bacteroidota bacterium]
MKVKFYKNFVTILFIIVVGSLTAQAQTITGTVIDEATGLSIPGVSVIQKGTVNGTITDIDGNYSINLIEGSDILQFSYIGYKTIEEEIGERRIINISMFEDLLELDEVVVIGYGVQQKKVVTGAISTLETEDITSTPVLRADQAMQGRAAGVQVTNMSGQPGEEPTVRIRGAGTTRDAAPLYVVDGFVVGSIDYLNPGDIESMDILKDAASAAIYGARAGNGVVLITTKSGKSGKMNVTFSGYYGIQNVIKKLDMLDSDQYMMIMNEGASNAGLTEPFDPNEIPKYNTNWQDEVFEKNVPIMNYNLAVSGGNDISTYSSSVSYFSQNGIIGGDKSSFERITARINSTHKVTKWFTFGMNLSYANMNRRGIDPNVSFNGAYSSALNMDPLTPVYETDPDILSMPPYSNEPVVTDANGNVYAISQYVGAEVVNPIALLEIQNRKYKTDQFLGNVYGEFEIIKGLKFKTSLGMDLSYVNEDSYRPLYYLNGAQNNTQKTSVYKSLERWYKWQWENTLVYSKRINDHNFSALIGTTASERRYDNLNGFNAKVPTTDPNNVYLDMAIDTAWQAFGGAWEEALLSTFGRITYDYKSKYAFTGIVRYDGSSMFGENNRYGLFPSVGVSWLLSEESFMPDLGPLSYLKLRASWGINGNDRIGRYQYLSVIDMNRRYILGGGTATGASPAYLNNQDIKWEQSEQIDIALDLGFFNEKLTATFDYYIKNTNGLLERIPIPAHVGNDPPYANVGSVRNTGIEFLLNWREYNKKVRYSIGLNGAYNKNEVTYIGNEEKALVGASWAIAGAVTRAEEGLPIGFFYGYKTDGIFQNEQEVYQYIGSEGNLLQPNAEPGDVRFVDINNDGIINEEDRTMIGDPIPDWNLGINAQIEYRNFDLSFLIIGAFGQELFNGSQRQDLRYTNRTTEILGRWNGEGTSNTIPRYTWIDVNNNYRVSDLYIEDGSYVRVKNIQLGYNIPAKFLKKFGSTAWRIYVSAENLLTFTKYTGPDPEIGSLRNYEGHLSVFDIGIDRGIYPQARTFRFGTSISF